MDLEQFGRDLLRAGAGLANRAAADVVRADLKIYTAGGHRFGAAQVEVADEPHLSSQIPRLTDALRELCEADELSFSILMITDVVGSWSLLLAHQPPAVLAELPYARRSDGSWHAPGLVSRKKQLLPALLGLLER
jgi:manganese-dependent inorganic pyrophosphatase